LLPALFGGKDKKINQFLKWISGNDNSDYSNPAFSVFTAGMKSFKGWATGTKIVVYYLLAIPLKKVIILLKEKIYNEKNNS